MGCRDDGQGAYESARREQDLKERLDKVTRLLCGILGGTMTMNTAEVRHWWTDHQLADATRRALEQAKLEDEQNAVDARIKRLEAELATLKGGR